MHLGCSPKQRPVGGRQDGLPQQVFQGVRHGIRECARDRVGRHRCICRAVVRCRNKTGVDREARLDRAIVGRDQVVADHEDAVAEPLDDFTTLDQRAHLDAGQRSAFF